MTSEQDRCDAVARMIQRFDAAYTVKQKNGSKAMKAIGWLFSKIGNKEFMEQFWTTVWNTTYCPTCTDTGAVPGEYKVLMHEGQHIVDNQALSRPLFSFLYMVPQILVLVPILLVLLGMSPWLLLLAPVFLAPLPAPFRAIFEHRAYCVSLAAEYWSGNEPDPKWATQYFTTGAYYFMWPFAGPIRSHFEKFVASLKDGTVKMTPYLTQCKALAQAFGAE